MMAQNVCMHEEICFQEDGIDNDDDDESEHFSDSENLNDQITNIKKGFQIELKESTASRLYEIAGTEETEVNNEMTVIPKPHILSTLEEQIKIETQIELGISYELDKFQVQALVALQNNRNVVLLAPCGSGKLLVFYMGVKIMRTKFNLPNGLGLCLQPLNNILTEKTNSDPPIPTAYLTMSGEGMKAENVLLTHSLDEISNGDIGCLLGHAESFLSSRGISFYLNIQ